jgi:hypothetical protein
MTCLIAVPRPVFIHSLDSNQTSCFRRSHPKKYNAQNLKQTNRFDVAPMSKMSGALPLLPMRLCVGTFILLSYPSFPFSALQPSVVFGFLHNEPSFNNCKGFPTRVLLWDKVVSLKPNP